MSDNLIHFLIRWTRTGIAGGFQDHWQQVYITDRIQEDTGLAQYPTNRFIDAISILLTLVNFILSGLHQKF